MSPCGQPGRIQQPGQPSRCMPRPRGFRCGDRISNGGAGPTDRAGSNQCMSRRMIEGCDEPCRDPTHILRLIPISRIWRFGQPDRSGSPGPPAVPDLTSDPHVRPPRGQWHDTPLGAAPGDQPGSVVVVVGGVDAAGPPPGTVAPCAAVDDVAAALVDGVASGLETVLKFAPIVTTTLPGAKAASSSSSGAGPSHAATSYPIALLPLGYFTIVTADGSDDDSTVPVTNPPSTST